MAKVKVIDPMALEAENKTLKAQVERLSKGLKRLLVAVDEAIEAIR